MVTTAFRGSVRSLTLLNAMLFATAFAPPAYAQIETVVVTAERKSEDIQSVPVSVTAMTAKDLKAKQVANFRDPAMKGQSTASAGLALLTFLTREIS